VVYHESNSLQKRIGGWMMDENEAEGEDEGVRQVEVNL
jgi:hypothetical protein